MAVLLRLVSGITSRLTNCIVSITSAPHSVMGMGFNVITSPDLLSPPPPGLVSCFQTSVNPDDAQACERINGGEGTMPPGNSTEVPIIPLPTSPPSATWSTQAFRGEWLQTIVATLVLVSLGTSLL